MTDSVAAVNLFRVDGLIAVITGGGTGIGAMMTTALAENGASKIYIVGRRMEKLQEMASKYPDIVVPLQADVTCQADLKRIADHVAAEVGYINLLITNAGMSGPMLEDLKPRYTLTDFVQHAWATPISEFTATYDLNCSALYYTVLAFMELLDAGNRQPKDLYTSKSQVIATASTASFLRHPRAGYAYLSSKAGVISLIKSLSSFCVPWGIRFNAIAAGLFPSDIAEVLFKKYIIDPKKSLTEEGVFSRSYQPAERAGSIEDMAGLILYMAGRSGAFLNGSVMLSDGGKLGTMPATY
ncbi:hypothetical protein VTL71DRAFT_7414 [Oculimacula yallundae]|uniref:Uncharacterized protein n=1 Tax=Oculimacula yallundae TaxID=86028 RepID=A0ABR4BVK4_9HELO